MRQAGLALFVLCLVAAWACLAPAARAEEGPTAADVDRAVSAYLEHVTADASLVGGPGSAGYDRGFWIRGGDFLLRTSLTLQARYEFFDWDNEIRPGVNGTGPAGGDLSGFSLPRATLRFSGCAPVNTRYFVELQFGHEGGPMAYDDAFGCIGCGASDNLGPDNQIFAFETLREAWVEWSLCSSILRVRMGQVGLPTTRQLMTLPEHQQFVDISLASSWTGLGMPGWTDRNRDFGVLLLGAFGIQDEWTWRLSVTNGDGGDGIRNVLNPNSSDALAYGGRVNFAPLGGLGYDEGAARQRAGQAYVEFGLWAFYYADRTDYPHVTQGNYLRAGVDMALGYGPVSFTGALTYIEDKDVLDQFNDDSWAFLAQLGFLVPGTKLELAVRTSGYQFDGDLFGKGHTIEYAGALVYYLNGHQNKLTFDASWIDTEDDGFLIIDAYPGYAGFVGNGDSAWLLRAQWQLAL